MDRFGFIKHSNICQSGLTCLSMICRYYDRQVDLPAIFSQAMSVEESLQEITDNAGKLGLSSVVGYLPLAKLSKVTLPCLLYWDNEYYVVLRKVKHGSYYIADPVKGLIKCSEIDVKQHWSRSQDNNEEKGIAVFIKTTEEFYKQAEKQNQLIKENPIRRYIKYLLFG